MPLLYFNMQLSYFDIWQHNYYYTLFTFLCFLQISLFYHFSKHESFPSIGLRRWLIDWLIDWLIVGWIDWFIDWFGSCFYQSGASSLSMRVFLLGIPGQRAARVLQRMSPVIEVIAQNTWQTPSCKVWWSPDIM